MERTDTAAVSDAPPAPPAFLLGRPFRDGYTEGVFEEPHLAHLVVAPPDAHEAPERWAAVVAALAALGRQCVTAVPAGAAVRTLFAGPCAIFCMGPPAASMHATSDAPALSAALNP